MIAGPEIWASLSPVKLMHKTNHYTGLVNQDSLKIAYTALAREPELRGWEAMIRGGRELPGNIHHA